MVDITVAWTSNIFFRFLDRYKWLGLTGKMTFFPTVKVQCGKYFNNCLKIVVREGICEK